MGRVIGSVLAGYAVVFAVVFALMSVGWIALGAEGSFQPGSWNVSGIWVVITVAVGLLAAIAGGYVCAMIAREPSGPLLLIGLVFVLGIAFAIPVLTGDPGAAGPRPETVRMADAMSNAIQPVWVALLNPVLGAAGVWIGARLRTRRPATG